MGLWLTFEGDRDAEATEPSPSLDTMFSAPALRGGARLLVDLAVERGVAVVAGGNGDFLEVCVEGSADELAFLVLPYLSSTVRSEQPGLRALIATHHSVYEPVEVARGRHVTSRLR